MKDWKKVKLGSLLTESKVISENPNPNNRIRVKLNVLGIEKRPETKDKKGATRYYIRKAGQFIYGKQNLHKGAFGIVPQELDGFESSSDIPAFDVDDSCYSEWIFYFFKKGNFYLKLENLAKGVGSKRINTQQIFELEIFLPSKEEQKNILDEINKIELNNTILFQEIRVQEENLKNLRKSILQDAILGKLTQKWRDNNTPNESASDLLEKIKRKRNQLIKNKLIKKEKPTPSIKDDEIPFEIPETWRWCRMHDISEKLGAGSTPKGGNSVYVSNGIMFFRSQNIYNEGLQLNNIALIPNEIHDKMKGSKVKAKDILLNITGGSIGRSTLIEDDFETANVSQHVAIVRLIELETRHYIHNLIMSPYFQGRIMDVQVGVSREGLSMTSLKKLLVPMPPIDEQKLIVEKINLLKSNCDKLEQEITTNKKQSDELTHSFLIESLGDEKNIIENKSFKDLKKDFQKREIKYNSKTTNMDLVTILKENGKLHAEDLWKMSEHHDDTDIGNSLDKFYADLKEKIEVDKTIREVTNEKGYLEII